LKQSRKSDSGVLPLRLGNARRGKATATATAQQRHTDHAQQLRNCRNETAKHSSESLQRSESSVQQLISPDGQRITVGMLSRLEGWKGEWH